MARNLLDPSFIAGKALFLRKLSGGVVEGLARAEAYAKAATLPEAKAMWRAVADHLRAN